MVVLGAGLCQYASLLTLSLPHPRQSPARHSLNQMRYADAWQQCSCHSPKPHSIWLLITPCISQPHAVWHRAY